MPASVFSNDPVLRHLTYAPHGGVLHGSYYHNKVNVLETFLSSDKVE
jgi:hypothetical protein